MKACKHFRNVQKCVGYLNNKRSTKHIFIKMDSSEEKYGSLVFFQKDGQRGEVCMLYNGEITIGSSAKANIRLKVQDARLERIHCIIEVNENGIATLVNKSPLEPVKVNDVQVRDIKVLSNEDKIQLFGKKFLYVNKNISKKDIEKREEFLNQAKLVSKERRSVTPLIKGTKKTPSLRTKTPSQRRSSVAKSVTSSNAEFIVTVTPEKRPSRRNTVETPKTTSKLIVSKALASPTKRQCLSLGSKNSRASKLFKNVSSAIAEKAEAKPSSRKANEFLEVELEVPLSAKKGEMLGNVSEKKETPVRVSSVKERQNMTNTEVYARRSSRAASANSTPRKSLASRGTECHVCDRQSTSAATSSRRSASRKSIRKSQKVQIVEADHTSSEDSMHLILSGTESNDNEDHIQETVSNEVINPLRQSLRKSRKLDKSIMNSEKSLRKTSTINKTQDENLFDVFVSNSADTKQSEVKDNIHDKIADKPRKSIRKTEEKSSVQTPNTSLANTKQPQSKKKAEEGEEEGGSCMKLNRPSLRKSRQSLRKSGLIQAEDQTELLSSDEDSLHLTLSEAESPKQFSEISDVEEDEATAKSFIPVEKQAEKRSSTVARRSLRWSNVQNEEQGEKSLNKSSVNTRQSKAMLDEIAGQSFDRGSTISPENQSDKVRQSLRRSKIEKEGQADEEPSGETSVSSPGCHSLNKSDAKYRRSLRGTKPVEREKTETLLNQSNEHLSVTSEIRFSNKSIQSPNKSVVKSRRSVRKNKAVDEEGDELSSEDSLILFEGSSPDISPVKFRKSSQKSKAIEDKEISGKRSTHKSMELRQSLMKMVERDINEGRSSMESSIASEIQFSSEEQSDNDEMLDVMSKTSETPKEKYSSVRNSDRASRGSKETPMMRSKQNETSKERGSSVRKSRHEKSHAGESSKANVSIEKTPKDIPNGRQSSPWKNVWMNSSNNVPLLYATGNDKLELLIGKKVNKSSRYSSSNDSVCLVETPDNKYTPKLRHSSVRKSQLTSETQFEEETSDDENSLNQASPSVKLLMNKSTPINKSAKALPDISKQNISIITLNDSVDSTPENNTSVIIIDTPLEKSQKSLHKRRSKAMTSTFESDIELTTPKSAIRNRRSKSLPYNPLTEDITPVSPLGKSNNESGFKTPINTPGLFENIKKSVLKSRSRSTMKAMKRVRESSGSSTRSTKRRKVVEVDTNSSERSSSFESFKTEDIILAFSEENISHETPKHFSDLTDKPVISVPYTRSLTEPKKERKSIPKRRSFYTTRLDRNIFSDNESIPTSEITTATDYSSEQSDDVFDNSTSSGSVALRRSSRRTSFATQTVQENNFANKQPQSPKDLSDVAGLKKLLKTPTENISLKSEITTYSSELSDDMFDDSTSSNRSVAPRRSSRRTSLATQTVQVNNFAKKQPQSPKDVSDVAGLKKLLKTPTEIKSPKNDLTDVKGVKKLFSTPKDISSPKNDLRNIPNLRNLMSPKQQNSPKNDLSDIAGLKKLLSTPKTVKSPENDLSNVPNLRRLMSPKQQNSPRNDLSDVAGVKKLLSTPKTVKSPANDLRNVPNLRRLMSPKQRNSPRNDLSDVAGVKKLLSTPKTVKSPENDLRKVPNLRKLMSPKQQKSPRNNLSDFAGIKKLMSTPKEQNSPKNDLSNIGGVKKLFATPKIKNSPKNDLTTVPNLRKIMSPKQQNSPKNDLSDVGGLRRMMKTPKKTKEPVNDLTNVEGVATLFKGQRLSNESDIENNEDLFDKIFAKKPLRTYRGKSLSPATRKAMVFADHRKTLGDSPVTSPRVEKWVQEQTVMNLKRVEKSDTYNEVFADNSARERKRRGRKLVQEVKVDSPKGVPHGKRGAEEKEMQEQPDTKKATVRKRALRGRKEIEKNDEANTENIVEPAKRTVRGKRKLVEKPSEEDGKAIVESKLMVDLMQEALSEHEIEFKRRKKIVRARKVDEGQGEPLLVATSITHQEEGDEAEHVSVDNVADASSKKVKNSVDEQVPEIDSTTEESSVAVSLESVMTVQSTESVDDVPRTRRRGRNVQGILNAVEEASKTSGRRRRRPSNREEDIINEGDTSAAGSVKEVATSRKTARSKRGDADIEHEVAIDEKVEPKKTRGRVGSETDEATLAVEVKITRGRRAVQHHDEGEVTPKILRRGRGRKKVTQEKEDVATASQEEEPIVQQDEDVVTKPEIVKRGRGRRKAAEDKQDVTETKLDTEEQIIVQLHEEAAGTPQPAKRGRGRKKATEAKKEDVFVIGKDVESSLKQHEEGIAMPVKRGRPKRKITEEKEEVEEVSKVGKEEESAKTVRSTKRGLKKTDSDEAKELKEDQSTKADRSRKKSSEEVENVEMETQSSRNTRTKKQPTSKETYSAELQEEVSVKLTSKRTRGRALEEELVAVDSPRTRARKGNFKKYGSDFITDADKMKSPSNPKKTVHFEKTAEEITRRPKRGQK